MGRKRIVRMPYSPDMIELNCKDKGGTANGERIYMYTGSMRSSISH